MTTANEVKHTPIPWEIIDRTDRMPGVIIAGPRTSDQFGREKIAEVVSGKDAELIVRAVNTHEGLLEQHGRDSKTLAEYAAHRDEWKSQAQTFAKRVQKQNDLIAELATAAKDLLAEEANGGERVAPGRWLDCVQSLRAAIAKVEGK